MVKIPIPNTIDNQLDPSYRYQREKLSISKQGQYYILDNIDTIIKQINSYSNSIEKIKSYLSNKLNQSIIIDKKTGLLKVKSIPIDIDDYIENYIKEYIICDTCNKPELNENNICNCCGNIKNL